MMMMMRRKTGKGGKDDNDQIEMLPVMKLSFFAQLRSADSGIRFEKMVRLAELSSIFISPKVFFSLEYVGLCPEAKYQNNNHIYI